MKQPSILGIELTVAEYVCFRIGTLFCEEMGKLVLNVKNLSRLDDES